jgi:hypothetical protein
MNLKGESGNRGVTYLFGIKTESQVLLYCGHSILFIFLPAFQLILMTVLPVSSTPDIHRDMIFAF